jgi:hypothetical protein
VVTGLRPVKAAPTPPSILTRRLFGFRNRNLPATQHENRRHTLPLGCGVLPRVKESSGTLKPQNLHALRGSNSPGTRGTVGNQSGPHPSHPTSRAVAQPFRGHRKNLQDSGARSDDEAV